MSFFFERNASETKYKDFPVSTISPRALCLSESCLLDLLWSDQMCKEVLERLFLKSTKTNAPSFILSKKGSLLKANTSSVILSNKGYLIQTLFSLKGYSGVGLQGDGNPAIRRKLRPSLFTNGHTVTLLAYDTLKTKKRRSQSAQDPQSDKTQSQSGVGDDGGEEAEETDDIIGDGEEEDDEDELFEDGDLLEIDDLLEVDEPFLDEEESDNEGDEQILASEPMDVESSSAMDVDLQEEGKPSEQEDKPRYKVNWKQRSRLLENVEVKYASEDKCPDPNNTVVIGIDPGEKYSVTVAKLDPQQRDKRWILRVSRRFLYNPYKKFRHMLEERN